MKSDYERIREEITTTAARVRAADEQAAQHEQAIRRDYDAALEKKSAALDAGDMDAFRAAGLEAEARRLDLEFIEGTKKKGPKPAATAEDDKRIMAALRAEAGRIRAEGLDKLKTMFTATRDECSEILRQLVAVDKLAETWGLVVMRQEEGKRVSDDGARWTIAQMENGEKAQLEKYRYIK